MQTKALIVGSQAFAGHGAGTINRTTVPEPKVVKGKLVRGGTATVHAPIAVLAPVQIDLLRLTIT